MRPRFGLLALVASAAALAAADDPEPPSRTIPPLWSFGAFPTTYLHYDTLLGADFNLGVIAGLHHDGGGIPLLFTGEADTFGPTASVDISTSGLGYGLGLGFHSDAYFFALPDYASLRLEFVRFNGMWNTHRSETITHGNHAQGLRLTASAMVFYVPSSFSIAVMRNTANGHHAIALGIGIGF